MAGMKRGLTMRGCRARQLHCPPNWEPPRPLEPTSRPPIMSPGRSIDAAPLDDGQRLQHLLAQQAQIQAQIESLTPSTAPPSSYPHHQHHRSPIHKHQSRRSNVPRSMSSTGAPTMARHHSVGPSRRPRPYLALMTCRIGSRSPPSPDERSRSSRRRRWHARTREARRPNEAATCPSRNMAGCRRRCTPTPGGTIPR